MPQPQLINLVILLINLLIYLLPSRANVIFIVKKYISLPQLTKLAISDFFTNNQFILTIYKNSINNDEYCPFKKKIDVDWAVDERCTAQIQSAVAKRDARFLADPLIDCLNAAPSTESYYSMGFSYGNRNGLYVNHAKHLSGQTLMMSKPLRNYDKECVYVDIALKCLILFVTGTTASIDLCDKKAYLEKYAYLDPHDVTAIASHDNELKLTSEHKFSEGLSDFQLPYDYFRENEDKPIALDSRRINLKQVPHATTIKVVGGTIEDSHHAGRKFKEFHAYYYAEITNINGKLKYNIHDDSFAECSLCHNDLTVTIAKLKKTVEQDF